MGCNCKGTTTTTGKTFIKNENLGAIIKSKLFFYLIFIVSAPVIFPLMAVLSLRSLITGKAINPLKVTTFFIPKKKNRIPNVDK